MKHFSRLTYKQLFCILYPYYFDCYYSTFGLSMPSSMKYLVYTLILTVILLMCSNYSNAQGTDITLLRKIQSNRTTGSDQIMHYISTTEYIVGVGVPVSVCAIALAKKDSKLLEKGVNMSFAIIANTINTYALKKTVNRPRPSTTYPDIMAYENERYQSFPSGHTSNAFALATTVTLNTRKWQLAIPSYVWAATVGYSRLHLGVHYPSDVLCGALLGTASAAGTYYINRWLKKKYYGKYIGK